MIQQAVRVVMSAVVATVSISATLGAQEPEKRAQPQVHIPVTKQAAAPVVVKPVIVKGTNTEVVQPPIIANIVTEVPGTNTVIPVTAPGIGARPVPWLPLLGLLGGAVLLATRDHGGEDVVTETTPPPEVPPVIPPVVPPVVPPEVPTTTVPEPTTVALFATGLAGLALAMRRKRGR